jgi:hypothetical protein
MDQISNTPARMKYLVKRNEKHVSYTRKLRWVGVTIFVFCCSYNAPILFLNLQTRCLRSGFKQGYEPSTFTSHFHGWDHSRWQVSILHVTFHGWNHCHCRIRYLCSNSTVGIRVSGGQDIYVA